MSRLGTALLAMTVTMALLGVLAPAAQATGCPARTDKTLAVASGAWDAAASWSPAAVPTSTDDVCIPPGRHVTRTAAAGPPAPLTVRSMQIEGRATFNNQAVTVTGGADAATWIDDSGPAATDGRLELGDTSSFTVAATAIVYLYGGQVLSSGPSATGLFRIAPSGRLVSYGTSPGGQVPTIQVRSDNDGDVALTYALRVAGGTTDGDSGTWSLTSTLEMTTAGTRTILPSGGIVGNTITFTAPLLLNGGGTFNLNGRVFVSTLDIRGAGTTVSLNGATRADIGRLDMSAGTLTGAGTWFAGRTGASLLTAGTISARGIVGAAHTFRIPAVAGTRTLAAPLQVDGTLDLLGHVGLAATGAVDARGTTLLSGNVTRPGADRGTFTSTGTLRNTTGTAPALIDAKAALGGTVELSGGGLELREATAGTPHAAAVTLAGAAGLKIGGGSHTFAGDVTGSGTSRVEIAPGGSAALAGGFSGVALLDVDGALATGGGQSAQRLVTAPGSTITGSSPFAVGSELNLGGGTISAPIVSAAPLSLTGPTTLTAELTLDSAAAQAIDGTPALTLAQPAGRLTVNGPLDLSGAAITGDGTVAVGESSGVLTARDTIQAQRVEVAGRLDPVGSLTIDGTLDVTAPGRLLMAFPDAPGPDEHITASRATVAGTLVATTGAGRPTDVRDAFRVLTCPATCSGAFAAATGMPAGVRQRATPNSITYSPWSASAGPDTTVPEAAGSVAIPVSLPGGALDEDVVLGVSSTDPADAGPAPADVTIKAGTTDATLLLPVVQDTADEPDETVTVTFAPAAHVGMDDTTVGVTIVDDDAPPDPTPTAQPPTPPTPPAPTPTPTPTPAPPPLPLACTGRSIVLVDVLAAGRGRVRVFGLALAKYVGQTVTIAGLGGKVAGATTTVREDGTFEATFAAPAAKLRPKIRYRASIGTSARSAGLRLERQLIVLSTQRRATGVRVTARFTGRAAGGRQPVTISRQLSCTRDQRFKTVVQDRTGRFVVDLPFPAGDATVAYYRAKTRIGRGGTTYTLPIAVRR